MSPWREFPNSADGFAGLALSYTTAPVRTAALAVALGAVSGLAIGIATNVVRNGRAAQFNNDNECYLSSMDGRTMPSGGLTCQDLWHAVALWEIAANVGYAAAGVLGATAVGLFLLAPALQHASRGHAFRTM